MQLYGLNLKKESTNSLREVGHAMFSLELELRRRAPF